MASITTEIRERLLSVICGGRGTDGSLGTDAQDRSITSGHFRDATRDTSLRGPTYPASEFDRAVQLRWLAVLDEPEESNELDPTQLRRARIEVMVGYLAASLLEQHVNLLGIEERSEAIAQWTDRAVNDAERVKRALCFSQLSCGALTTVRLIGIAREGSTVTEDLSDGRGLSLTTYRILFSYSGSASLTP